VTVRRLRVLVLGAAIVLVLVVAVGAVLLTEPRLTSQAAPPRPAGAVALPATVRPPVSAPARPVTPATSAPDVTPATHLSTGWGVDVSWPQCGALGMPAVQPGFVVVGVNGGRPFTDNSCLAREVTWARTRTGYSAYVNIDAPRSGDPTAYGRKVALDALARAERAGLHVPVLWLDVEVLNHWSRSAADNIAIINGAIRALRTRGVTAGIYSSVPMWRQITGGAPIGVPVWLATSVTDYRLIPQECERGLGGREAEMAQYVAWDGHQLVDVDVLCQHAIPQVVGEFARASG
jgi:hypothetical protein